MVSYVLTIWRPMLIAALFSLFLLLFVPQASVGIYIHAAQPFVRAMCVIYAVYLLISKSDVSPYMASLSSFLIIFFDHALILGIGLVMMGAFADPISGAEKLKLFIGMYIGLSLGFMAIGFVAAYFINKARYLNPKDDSC